MKLINTAYVHVRILWIRPKKISLIGKGVWPNHIMTPPNGGSPLHQSIFNAVLNDTVTFP
jgi:hypothetical protein